MNFQDFKLHPDLLRALADIGFDSPTPIQAQAIPAVLEGRDVLGSAQTGTGKTAAFLLPSFHRLLVNPGLGLQVLVLEPTRELAVQVEEQAKLFGKYSPLRSACIYGGVAMGPQETALRNGVEIIAATPGRLLDHMRQGHVDARGLRVLVLDEVDRMLDMGFLPDVRSILRQLPAERQTLFFSATVPGEIQHLCDSLLQDPVRVAVAPEKKTAEGIAQKVYPVTDHLKPVLLNRLLTDEGVSSALIFTRTRQGADKVCSVVERHSSGSGQVERIHGDRSQKERQAALQAFKDGRVKFLVATDIAARGLDVDGISHVINYDLPESPEDYVHRIGRTARAGATGHAYSLVSSRESLLLSAIEQHLNMKLEKCMLEDFNYEEVLGAQHEVRQGHDGIKPFDDKRGPRPQEMSAAFGAPPLIKDSDERATIIVRRFGAVEGQAAPFRQSDRPQGGREGSRSGRRRGGRGGEHPRGEARGEARREPIREARRESNGSSPSPSPQMSATDVLRRAGSQKAAVESTALELRPRGEVREASPAAESTYKLEGPAPKREEGRAPTAPSRDFQNRDRERDREREGQGGPRRRRRRGGRRHGAENRPEQRLESRSSARPEKRYAMGEAPKPSLLSKLKGFFGLGSKKSSDSGLGDKW